MGSYTACGCFFVEILQKVLEKPLEKKAGRNYGPAGNKTMIYFVDDLNVTRVMNTATRLNEKSGQIDFNRVHFVCSGRQIRHGTSAHVVASAFELQTVVRQIETNGQRYSQYFIRVVYERDVG